MSALPQFYLGTAPITNWKQLGGFSVFSPIDSQAMQWSCVVNGRFSILFMCNGFSGGDIGKDKGFVLVSFDEDGSTCVYQSSAYGTGTGNNSRWTRNNMQTVRQSGNDFTYQGFTSTHSFRIPNTYLPGGVFIIPDNQVSIPAPPCGTGTFNSAFYVDDNTNPNGGYIVYEYTRAFGINSNFYCVVSQRGIPLAGGFLGNYLGSTEPLYKFVQQLPPNAQAGNLVYKNEAFVVSTQGLANPGYVGAATLSLNGPWADLQCGGTGTNVTIDTGVSFNMNVQALTGFVYTANVGDNMCAAGCSIANTWATPINRQVTPTQQVFSLFNAYQWLDIVIVDAGQPFQPTSSNSLVCANATNRRFYVAYASNNGKTFSVRSADMGRAFDPPPNLVRSQHDGLYNYHRAVSPNGTFQA